MIEKKATTYVKFSEFRDDISWFVHNCKMMHSGDALIQGSSAFLEPFIKEEIDSIIDCKQCYTNAFNDRSSGFVTLCQPPHPIVWAFSELYWPEKVMKRTGNSVRVRYFGDDTNEVLAIKDCFKYSEKSPQDPSESVEDMISL